MNGNISTSHSSKTTSGIIKKAAALLALIVVSIFFLWLLNRDSSDNDQTAAASRSGDRPMSENALMEGLEDAARAALTAEPVNGSVTKRPDFVSELEWQVLQNTARKRSGKNDIELTRLVNKLLFAKKWEAWLASKGDTMRRKTLATRLTAMIPEQVRSRSLDPAEAKKIEAELHAEMNKSGH